MLALPASGVCWAESDEEALETAVESVDENDAEEMILYGLDPEQYVEHIQEFVDAGFERVSLHHLGQDQQAFLEFMEREVVPEFSYLVVDTEARPYDSAGRTYYSSPSNIRS